MVTDITRLIDATQKLDSALKDAYGEGLYMEQCACIFGDAPGERWDMLVDIRQRMGGSVPPYAAVSEAALAVLEAIEP